ncbi:NAD(P)-binding protein [Gonapodya prolifera JEL478]|uniref:NAD(P)-binding protein n=1 Tax=Gonapodya prolifera (strain JEL478) TaxID=1344416 RepID=A0A139A597_GONPJ|nr:NAD(P)-binding protein [Gonapodya prolifera JEL478]|eukprot:KXS11914.1 NAD(P)-binding protein [Gonapodya prolifera JEL478]
MSAPPTVLIIGSTGATGFNILTDSRSCHIIGVIQQSTLNDTTHAPRVAQLRSLGVEIRSGSTNDTEEKIRVWLQKVDVVVSAVVARDLLTQIKVVKVTKEVGVTSFVPSDFAGYFPSGVMALQDKKEIVHKYIVDSGIGYIFIDTGSWYVEAGLHHRLLTYTVIGSGDLPNAITHHPDVGNLVAKIVLDPRTLNKRVFCMAETITMNQMGKIYEEETGNKLTWTKADDEQTLRRYKELHATLPPLETNPDLPLELMLVDYTVARWIRGYNVPPEASLKSWHLYPEFKCIRWRGWIRHVAWKGVSVGAQLSVAT